MRRDHGHARRLDDLIERGIRHVSSPAEKKETPAQPAAEKPVEPEAKPAAPAPAAEPTGAEKKADENIEDIGIAKICRSVAKGFFHIDDDKKS
jgi:type IV secretory pathway VirB10-like protein